MELENGGGIGNLNSVLIENHDGAPVALAPNNALSQSGEVQVFFRDLEAHLVRHIEAAPVVIGCVAWLTSKAVLEALSSRKAVAIVVQKEDFLRPDIGVSDRPEFRSRLRQRYDKLPGTLSRYAFEGNVLRGVSYTLLNTVDAVRCVGNMNREKRPAFPRMHHKFAVFCNYRFEPGEGRGPDDMFGCSLEPYAVWTGSFNWTENAGRSLENAVVLTDPAIVDAYYQEFGQIAALSEPLDWEADWMAPEWRIGS